MMSDINITTSIAQMPNVQGVAGAQLAHPEAQQVLAAQLAHQVLKDQTHQVQKVEKQEASEAVKDEKEGGHGGQDQHLRKRQAKSPAPDESETPAEASSPWIGHLINRKV